MKKLLTVAAVAVTGAGHAAPVFTTDAGGGVTTDVFDISQGAAVIRTTQVLPFGGEDIREAFGGNGGVEGGNVMFEDGHATGYVDTVWWQTGGVVNLNSVQLRFSQDGGDPNRSPAAYTLFASQDGINYSAISSGIVPLVGGPGTAMTNAPLLITDSALAGTTVNVRGFKLEITRNTGSGPRFVEIDGFGTAGNLVTTYLDPLVFNATSNTAYTGQGADDDGPGAASGFASSPSVAGGIDDIEAAFGNNNGPVEPASFIFADGGTPDNGNGVFGDGGEAVDFISWHTATPLSLAGFKIGLTGDGGGNPFRDTELVRFLVEGNQVDLFDNNGFDGDVTRLFSGGAVVGDDFRIEFTRTTAGGARIFEIDAILGPTPVPEPTAAAFLLMGTAASLRRRRS